MTGSTASDFFATTPDTRGACWCHDALTMEAPSPHDPSLAPDRILRALEGATRFPGAETFARRWQPYGLSVTIFSAAGRLVMHTWPELGLATVDVNLAGARSEISQIIERLGRALGWRIAEHRAVPRIEGVGR